MIIHWLVRIFKLTIPYKELLALLFYMQALHLIVPPLDALGLRYRLPWHYTIGEQTLLPWFTKTLIMTSGIIIVWLLSAVIIVKIFKKYWHINITTSGLLLFLSFNFLYWLTYHFWPLFNTVFLIISSRSFNIAKDQTTMIYWGYGFFFLFSSLAGLIYYYRCQKTQKYYN